MMDKTVIKRTRCVGDLDYIHDLLWNIENDATIEITKIPPGLHLVDESEYLYIKTELEPKVRGWINQYNRLMRSLFYTYLIRRRVDLNGSMSSIPSIYEKLKVLELACFEKMPKIDECTDYFLCVHEMMKIYGQISN